MSEELLRENERLKASNHRLEVEAIQRQGESDRVRLAARAQNERLRARVAELEADLVDAMDDLRLVTGSFEP